MLFHHYFKDTSKDISVKVIERYKKQHSYATNPLLDACRMETTPNDYERIWRIYKKKFHNEALVNTKIAESVIKK